MKNQQHWDFAQNYSSKLMLKLGIGMMICGVIGLFLPIHQNAGGWISIGIIILSAIILLWKTETALHQKFGD